MMSNRKIAQPITRKHSFKNQVAFLYLSLTWLI